MSSAPSFGRRSPAGGLPVLPQPGPRPAWHVAIPLFLFIVAAAAALMIFQNYRSHPRPPVSPAEAAAIDHVLAGEQVSIPAIAAAPNVSLDYYDVDGTDAAAIRHDLDAKGPVDAGGRHLDAETRWHYDWHWPATADGSCGTPKADVSFSAVIRLPRLTHFADLKPGLAQAWRSYMTALVRHEAGHVANGFEGRDAITAAVRSSSCADANAAGQQAIAALGGKDADYDRRTNHGATEGASFN